MIPVATQAERYAQCDACGLCKDTSKSTPTVSHYIKPSGWDACFTCLYSTLGDPSLTCVRDELGRIPEFHDIFGGSVSGYCDSLLMAPYESDETNAPVNKPQSGRMFSDLGCISVDTAAGSFSDPNASVDVIQILLNLVISATGAVGTILVIAAAARLILSKGDPEKIREGKKTLTNVVLGLLFALFGLFIFRFFAAQVLRIPGFN